MEDVGIDQLQFNVGQQLLSLGIVLFEIPSNMALYKVGVPKKKSLRCTRLIRCREGRTREMAYTAVVLVRTRQYLSSVANQLFKLFSDSLPPGRDGIGLHPRWFVDALDVVHPQRNGETNYDLFLWQPIGTGFCEVDSVWYVSNHAWEVTRSPADPSSGILHMKGVAGYPGWFWLFVIMGGFTTASGILLGFCLPDSVDNPCSLFLPQHAFFSERELYILRHRVQLDDPGKSNRKQHIGLEAFRRAVSNVDIETAHCG